MCTTHGVSNAFSDELLKYLTTVLLPTENCLPSSFYQARNSIRKMGLEYNVIHCCPKDHVLFRGEHENLDHCPHAGCGLSRWVPGSQTIPAKVLRHFPHIPRLRRMFASPAITELLRWASENKTGMEEMRSVADSPAWDHIDREVDPQFATESRNLRMGLSLDGLNPFSMQRTSHSTWPILLVIYNLPPWLCTKRFFVTLSLLISGKESPTFENIDIFLAQLVEELQELWNGVEAYDAVVNTREDRRTFTLRGILMWTIADFPAYGLTSGLCTKGFLACPICGLHTIYRTARGPKKFKQVFLGARRWTSRSHPYRLNRRFNGSEEHAGTPPRQSASDILRSAELRTAYLRGQGSGRQGRPDEREDPYRRLAATQCPL
jgi:hypothetical protein